MKTTISMTVAKKRLAILWFIFGGFLFLILFLQTLLTTYYGDKVNEAWSWFLPTIVPAFSLITAVFAHDVLDQDKTERFVDRFYYLITFALSLVYLVAISLVFLLCPLKTEVNPIDVMKLSNFGLGPFQGIIIATLGIFFVKKEKE